MTLLKTSLICTVLNEEKTVRKLLDSIANQSLIPYEVIFVDGGSSDRTVAKIKDKISKIKNSKIRFLILEKKGNRSVGRNEAIKKASGEIILSTDAGCVLDKNWIKNIIKPFKDKTVDVVAGYYRGYSRTIFQKSLIPYVLVMPDRVNPQEFLPATRSMAFKKAIWKKIGGFDEGLSNNEDYAFANKLRKNKAKIAFEKDAVIYWLPRNNIFSAFRMFFRFALGDAESNIFREKVMFIFLRYIFAVYLFALIPIMKSLYYDITVLSMGLVYLIWAIKKNYRYVSDKLGLIYLPLLQLTSDAAVMSGTLIGVGKQFSVRKIIHVIRNNKFLFLIILVYSLLMFLLLQWGIPNSNHPFNYAMDEWHFSQALRTFIKDGTGSVSGAASIPLYHIVSSILFLVPFYLLHIVNPLAIKYTLDNLPMQHTLFEILRLHTLFYGILSTIVIYKLLKHFIKTFSLIFTALFVFNPIWISLTNYYKYDVTLSFWIIMNLYFLINYFKTQKLTHFIYAGIALGLALSTKFTVAPLFIAYILGYFILSEKIKYKEILLGIFITLFVFAFMGVPDLIFGKGSYYQLLYSTLIQSPKASLGFNLGYPSWFFLLFKEFPSIFGYFLSYLFYISLLFWIVIFFFSFINRKIKDYKLEIFMLVTAILFLVSIILFSIDGGGNRALVLIPFIVLVSALFVNELLLLNKNYKKIILSVLFAGLIIQSFQSALWISVKFYSDPREVSSEWILKNIPVNSQIGIENIPIYQMLPDFVIREFYFKQRDQSINTRYEYSVVSAQTNSLPQYVIVTNDFDNMNYIKNSPKKDLVNKLQNEKYKKIKTFSPNLKYYRIFADERYFVLANIIPMPVKISIYEK